MEEDCNTTVEASRPSEEPDLNLVGVEQAGGTSSTNDMQKNISTSDTPTSKRIKLDSNFSEEASLVGSEEEPITLDELNKKKKCIKQKKELLDQLELVKLYQNKWSFEELTDLTTSWKDVAISAFQDLHQVCSVNEALTKKDLIKHLGIDGSLIDIDVDADSE